MKAIACSNLTESFGMVDLSDEELLSVNGGVSEAVAVALIGAAAVVVSAIITTQCSQPSTPCIGIYCPGYSPRYNYSGGSRC